MPSKKFIVGGLVLVLALSFLGYRAFGGSVAYYYTVTELVRQGNSTYLQGIRVNGVVVPGTVEPEADNLTIKFMLTDNRESLLIIYRGVVPQTFDEGTEVVVEGKYSPGGAFFEANRILTRCPSKYVSRDRDSKKK